MAKNKNTFEKRRKEIERMRKAQEKRERRFARRSKPAQPVPGPEPAAPTDPVQGGAAEIL